jgi:protein-tyrosine phosphatase
LERILVLCYGNIYRSPLAAAYLARTLCDSAGCQIRSAGFHPRAGRESSEDFVRHVLHRTGLDLSAHRSSLVSVQDLEWAQMVVIMDRHNWHALAKASGGSDTMSRVLWLGALRATGPVEIGDPYGRSEDVMAQIVEDVVESAERLGRVVLERGRRTPEYSRPLP